MNSLIKVPTTIQKYTSHSRKLILYTITYTHHKMSVLSLVKKGAFQIIIDDTADDTMCDDKNPKRFYLKYKPYTVLRCHCHP